VADEDGMSPPSLRTGNHADEVVVGIFGRRQVVMGTISCEGTTYMQVAVAALTWP